MINIDKKNTGIFKMKNLFEKINSTIKVLAQLGTISMRFNSFAFVVVLLLMSGVVKGQVTLTATAGTATGSFTTLKGAFDEINSGTHTGDIVISLTANTTETAPAVLNVSGSGSASYTSLSIQPSGGAARTISGAIATGSPLIDLNGADNVTIQTTDKEYPKKIINIKNVIDINIISGGTTSIRRFKIVNNNKEYIVVKNESHFSCSCIGF